MKLYFTISEFNISGKPIPEAVADKILEYHIVPLQAVREAHGKPIYVSQNSGYRSLEWEKSKGRSGESEHCFGEQENGTFNEDKGAVDLRSEDLDRLESDLIEHSPYTRICRYKSFIHCDYKPQERILYKNTPKGWQRVKKI
jgi:hypothetical protein